jgi:stage V sporulation protein B
MKQQGFIKGAFILTLAGFASKLMGALYRIPLARLLGGEGMGLYQMAYPIYTMILAVSTAGIPVAISILVAEKQAQGDYRGGMRIFKIALFLLTLTGLFFSLIVFCTAEFLAKGLLNDERSFYAIIAISPAILITAVNSAFRGFFQGNRTMTPTAISQVFEQLIRVTTVLAAAYLLLPYGIEFSAAGATFGAVTGSIFALFVLIIFYITYPKRNKYSGELKLRKEGILSVTGRILYIALPLSLGGLVMPVMQFIDAVLVPMRLQSAGYGVMRSTELFGQLSGMANTLINLPIIITISLSVSLVPAISEIVSKGQMNVLKRRIMTALRVTFLLCLPAAAGLCVLATPISVLLYDIAEVGVSLSVLGPAVIFLGLYQITAAVLQGMRKTYLPVKNLFLGALIKIILTYWLTAVGGINIRGAAFATVCGFLIAFLLNYYDIKKHLDFKINWLKILTGPVTAAAVMSFTVYVFYDKFNLIIGSSAATLLAVFLGIVVYGCAAMITGAVKVKDLEMLSLIRKK